MNVVEDICLYCEKPFKHKVRRVRSKTDPNVVSVEVVDAHPYCTRIHKKVESLNKRIEGAKKKLHDLRVEQLNLEFEVFLKTTAQRQDNTDEVYVLASASREER